MIKKLYPNFFYENVQSIPYSFFIRERIKAVIFDMDNTLVNSRYEYNKDVKTWLKGLKKQGIKICILSNTPRYSKIKKVGKELSMPFLYNALKPWSFGFKKALVLLEEEKKNTVIIGDQLFTDIYGGNRFGIRTILVNPIEKRELWMTKIKRPLENSILKRYKKEVLEVR